MQQQIAQNKFKSMLMMAGFVGFIGVLGYILSQVYNSPSLLVSSFVFGTVYALFSYFLGTRMSLAVNGAKEISRQDNSRLWDTVVRLADRQGLPMPKVYIMQDPALNAFATGRNHQKAVVCATTGLLDALTDEELEGVIGHELGHVKNYDIRVSMIAFALSAVVSIMADFVLRATFFRNSDDDSSSGPVAVAFGLVAAIVAPLVATLIQLAVSRRREYLADATGAATTHNPIGLAGALRKIAETSSQTRKQNTSTAHLFFANPLRPSMLGKLFSTHPPIEQRIARLEEMAQNGL